jgi:indolepyruvate ferredoxin oxidoreductase alpha subunit
MEKIVLLGDEAVAQAAIDSGLSAGYGYPGTPSTEIMEYLVERSEKGGAFYARWCSNEKTALEAALGASFAGQRAIVTMKHVGLNVAADPLLNASVLKLTGGLVIAVADDPGMHSSQDEQDSRFYAEFAGIPCLEPANQQEAYAMTREAFDLSERFRLPVILRLVTRLSHSRAAVELQPARAKNPLKKPTDPSEWMLLPAYAKKNYEALCRTQKELEAWSEASAHSPLYINESFTDFGVITTGLGKNYYLENASDFAQRPSHLHVGTYPVPYAKIRELASKVKRLIIVEEGQPLLERSLRGAYRDDLSTGKGAPAPSSLGLSLSGKLDGALPRTGELNPDLVRVALGLKPHAADTKSELVPPGRPPQLCQGCPHADSYTALNEALQGLEPHCVNADIGCYSLGALPPYNAIESIVCMGASIGMARGANAAGIPYAVAVIGDSTFYHSGITPLVDAISAQAHVTVLILDNSIVAMTGCQPTIMPSDKLASLVSGLGVDPAHVRKIEADRLHHEENVKVLREEIEYRGVSVVIASRVCLEAFRKSKQKGASK